MNKSILFLAVASLVSAAARAEDPPVPFPLTANVSLTTNYKFRGQNQNNSKAFSPALQGGFDWSMNGFYIGNWNSNVGLGDAHLEMDFYGGYKGEITKEFTYDVGVLQYYYPQKDKVVSYNTTELYGALSFGPGTLKYSHTVSKDYFGYGEAYESVGVLPRPSGRNTGYLDLSVNFPISEPLVLNLHAGYTRYSSDLRDAQFAGSDVGLPNYYDYKAGVTYDLSKIAGAGVSIAGAFVGANKKGFYGDINKGRFIVTLTKTL